MDVEISGRAVSVSVEVDATVRYSWVTLSSTVERTVVRAVARSVACHVVEHRVHVDAAYNNNAKRISGSRFKHAAHGM